jgi:hypothetical protein
MIALLQLFLRRHGVNVCSNDHVGFDVEVDFERLFSLKSRLRFGTEERIRNVY